MVTVAAWVFAGLVGVLCLFHGAMALGAPWGHLTMGGAYPGRLKGAVRLLPILAALLLIMSAAVVLDRAGLIDLAVPEWSIWAVLGLIALTCVANGLTPSRPERLLWFPVTVVMLACVLVVTFAAVD